MWECSQCIRRVETTFTAGRCWLLGGGEAWFSGSVKRRRVEDLPIAGGRNNSGMRVSGSLMRRSRLRTGAVDGCGGIVFVRGVGIVERLGEVLGSWCVIL